MGHHLLLDCENITLDFNNAIDLINEGLKKTDVNVLSIIKNRSANGYSIVYLLSESHLSLHYWENGNISIDFYNCSQKNSLLNCEIFREHIFKEWGIKNVLYHMIIKRGDYTKTIILKN